MSALRVSATPLVVVLTALAGAAIGSSPVIAQPEQPLHGGGVGLICISALVSNAAEAGRRCPVGANPQLQNELERSERRLEDYVLQNSAATRADIARFKSDQVSTDHPNFCANAGGIHRIYAQAGPERLRREIDTFLSRRPAVEWGTCL
jgi:hypothetical protein